MNPFLQPLRVGLLGCPDLPALDPVHAYVARLHAGCTVLTTGRDALARAGARAARERGLRERRAGTPLDLIASCEHLVIFSAGGGPGLRELVALAREHRRSTEIVPVPGAAPPPRLELRR